MDGIVQAAGKSRSAKYRAIFDYAESIRLPVDSCSWRGPSFPGATLRAGWIAGKKKSDWRPIFAKAVEGTGITFGSMTFRQTSSPDLERALREGRPHERPRNAACPPSSVEAEQYLIGGLLLDNRAWTTWRHCPESGFLPGRPSADLVAHGGLINAGKPADVLTVGERIEAANESDQTGGLAYLATMAAESAGAAMAKSYAGIVAEKGLPAPCGLWRHDPGHRRGDGHGNGLRASGRD